MCPNNRHPQAMRREWFVYVFDFGDDWAHLFTVAAQRLDPVEVLGIVPECPLPYVGWATSQTSAGAAGTARAARARCRRTLARHWCIWRSAPSEPSTSWHERPR
jgi:hypothetical protein